MSSWIGISDHEGSLFDPSGLTDNKDGHSKFDPDAMLVRGSLVIETRLPQSLKPQALLHVERGGGWPFHLSLQAIPGGGLTFLLNQGAGCHHCTTNSAEVGRTDLLRLTYSWDAPARFGQLAVERLDRGHLTLLPVDAPNPLRYADIQLLLDRGPQQYLSPDVLYLALSSNVEPVGPMPSMTPETPVATPNGYRPVGSLQRGDTVYIQNGDIVPVLHRVSRTVPARGSFRPVRLRAPFFGLQRDIVVSPAQRLVLTGSEVEYLFGSEAVLVEMSHLVGEPSVRLEPCGPTVTYDQLILPGHEPVVAAGTIAETLYVGRLRRKRDALFSSLLAGLDRQTLPEHGRPIFPVLNAFDSVVLAEQRAA